MKRWVLIFLMMGVATFVAPLSRTYAATPGVDYPYFGPQTLEDDFLHFGNTTWPRQSTQGITLTMDEPSTSFQSIFGRVLVDWNQIEEREITQFYLLANNRIVDTFDPVWDMETERYKNDYYVRFALEDWNIGSIVTLQVAAVHHAEPHWQNPEYYDTRYVVAWSNTEGPIQLKPQPVIDREAVTVLEAILAKLEALKSSLEGRLDMINASIRKIYEVTPQTQQKFDQAMANLQAKLPTEQMKNEANNAQRVIEDSANRINNATQRIKFGEINWMGVVTTPAVDFTDFMDEITGLRRILQIMLWCEFFYFVILILRPRLTV